MSKANESAFPYIHKWKHKTLDGDVELASRSNGLTKREYFAAMALQCIGNFGNKTTDIAKSCILIADELILELEKTKK